MPTRFSSRSGPVHARSVPASRRTAYSSGDSSSRHCSSVFCTRAVIVRSCHGHTLDRWDTDGNIRFMDDVRLLDEVLAKAATLIGNVKEDQWELPTPCPDYDVKALVGHMVGWAQVFASAA